MIDTRTAAANNGDLKRMAFHAIARAAGAIRRSHCAVVCALVGAVLAGCASSNNEAAKALNLSERTAERVCRTC